MAGVAVGLDFGAIMAVATAQGADAGFLSEVLPEAEVAILAGISGDSEGED